MFSSTVRLQMDSAFYIDITEHMNALNISL
jgi:hypothetical protein